MFVVFQTTFVTLTFETQVGSRSEEEGDEEVKTESDDTPVNKTANKKRQSQQYLRKRGVSNGEQQSALSFWVKTSI